MGCETRERTAVKIARFVPGREGTSNPSFLFNYLPFDEEGAHCLFQLISRRYEKSSTILTSNKSYGEWGEIFKDHVIAAAVLDRILHHSTTINIKGESYRLKERKKQGIKTGNIFQ